VTHRIGIIGGDGIGPEVVAEALKVVDAAGVAYEPVPFDLSGARYLRDGVVIRDEDVEAIRGLDAVLLGAVCSCACASSSTCTSTCGPSLPDPAPTTTAST